VPLPEAAITAKRFEAAFGADAGAGEHDDGFHNRVPSWEPESYATSKNFPHELQNQLPGFGPLGISLNFGHVAASRIVSPITPTCTDAVLHVPHLGHGGTSIRANR
jgi:hypothetical protein